VATENLKIRLATVHDKPKILKLVEHTWSWGDYIPTVLDDWLKAQGSWVFVCFLGDELVGMVHLAAEEGGLGWLEGARVSAQHRNKGIATMLAHHVLGEASRLGLSKVRLAVAADNAPSIRHVSKVGFRPLAKFKRLSAKTRAKDVSGQPIAPREGDVTLITASKDYAMYRELYYRSFRWLDLDVHALKQLMQAERALWFGELFVIHSSEYEQEGEKVAEVGYLQGDTQNFDSLLSFFGSKSYSRVDFVVPEEMAPWSNQLSDVGEKFIVFEIKS